MKCKITSFIAGMLATLMLGSITVTALAADSGLTLTAYPIKVLVNGEVFKPKDVNGNDVLVFTYNGTTYAPLRALAEAYGLEVGYDATSNTATVNHPTKAMPSTDFADQWTVEEKPVTNYGTEKIYTAKYNGSMSMNEFKTWWKSMGSSTLRAEAEKLAAEAQGLVPSYSVTMYFSYGSYNLGTAYAFGSYEASNFDAAGVWIK